MNDAAFMSFQEKLIEYPTAGDVIVGAGGLRKVRFTDSFKGKGKRGGLRIIYYWWGGGFQFWLFTLYRKGEMKDLNAKERRVLAQMLRNEIQARRSEERRVGKECSERGGG